MDNFHIAMSKRSSIQLIKILEQDFSDYHPSALSAASKELQSRNLTTEDIDDLKKIIAEQQFAKAKKSSLNKNIVSQIFEYINPKRVETSKGWIMLLSFLIVAWMLFGYDIYDSIYYIQYGYRYLLFNIELWLLLILTPIGIFGFWRYRKFGWIIISILLIHFFSTNIFVAFWELTQPELSTDIYFFLIEPRADKGMIYYTTVFFILICSFIYINQKIIRDKYNISTLTSAKVFTIAQVPLIIYILASVL